MRDQTAPAARIYRARPRRREFVIAVVDDVHRESGPDLTVDAVLDDLARLLRDAAAKDLGAADYAETFDDQVIWEGNRVVAVVRFDAGTRGLDVVRFDGPPSAPTGTAIQAPPDADDEADD